MPKKEGPYYSTSKVLTSFQMKYLENLVDQNIKKSGKQIINGDFSINPKMVGNINESCMYCSYKDLCFRKDQDIKKLNKNNDLSFLEEYE